MNRFLLVLCVLMVKSEASLVAQTTKDHYTLTTRTIKRETFKGKDYWLIECTFKNNSKDTINYMSMSCSWTDFYSVNKKELEIERYLCNKNNPIILTLAPGEYANVILKISYRKGFKKTNGIHFRIGQNIIKSKSTDNYEIKLGTHNIIWSNSISLS